MLLRSIILFSCLLLANGTFAQRKMRSSKPDMKSLPKEITYEGTIVHAVSWKDKAGSHVFLATETGMNEAVDSTGESGRTGYILAQHYLLGDTIRRTWTEGDSIVLCKVDTELGFLPVFDLTDLDKDGYYELWLMKKSACHGDVSPAAMQLVMHEENQRFSMIGTNKVQIGENQFIGGEYDFNNQFLEGNPSFKKRGMDIWNDHLRGF